jgi:hypothetical protein
MKSGYKTYIHESDYRPLSQTHTNNTLKSSSFKQSPLRNDNLNYSFQD